MPAGLAPTGSEVGEVASSVRLPPLTANVPTAPILLLRAGRELAVAEEGTVTWYAFKISDTSYGIFDTFAIDDTRTAHINGQIPAALAKVSADLLASEPDIRPVAVLAVK